MTFFKMLKVTKCDRSYMLVSPLQVPKLGSPSSYFTVGLTVRTWTFCSLSVSCLKPKVKKTHHVFNTFYLVSISSKT